MPRFPITRAKSARRSHRVSRSGRRGHLICDRALVRELRAVCRTRFGAARGSSERGRLSRPSSSQGGGGCSCARGRFALPRRLPRAYAPSGCGHPGPHPAGASLLGRREGLAQSRDFLGFGHLRDESSGRACGFSDCLVANSQYAGDRAVAHAEVAQVLRLIGDPQVDRHVAVADEERLDRDAGGGSNSLRPRPLIQFAPKLAVCGANYVSRLRRTPNICPQIAGSAFARRTQNGRRAAYVANVGARFGPGYAR